jgi:hypothetical protein
MSVPGRREQSLPILPMRRRLGLGVVVVVPHLLPRPVLDGEVVEEALESMVGELGKDACRIQCGWETGERGSVSERECE